MTVPSALANGQRLYDSVIELWNAFHKKLNDLGSFEDREKAQLFHLILSKWERVLERIDSFVSTPDGARAWRALINVNGEIYRGNALVCHRCSNRSVFMLYYSLEEMFIGYS